MEVMCGECGATVYTRATKTTTCRNCAAVRSQNVDVVDGWLRRIAYGDSELSKLPSGPITTDNIDTNRLEIQEKQMLHFIGSTASIPGMGTPTPVAYLPGDERRAAELFIEENTEYCYNWFESNRDGVSPDNFDPEMRDLLKEQWILGGHEEVTPQ